MGNRYGYIYITTNNINGKKYIGQHVSKKFESNYHGSGKYLGRAVSKYGIENFTTELIEWCYSREELDKREIYWIGYYDAVESNNFYNLQAGGSSGNIAGSKLSDETKILMSISRKKYYINHNGPMLGKHHSDGTKKIFSLKRKGLLVGDKNPMYGRHKTDEEKKHMSDMFTGDGNPFYGRKHNDETKKKISESRIGNKNPGAGKRWMIRGEESKRVLPEDVDKYISDGWKFGRFVSQKTRDIQRENVKNRRDELGRFKSI